LQADWLSGLLTRALICKILSRVHTKQYLSRDSGP
jgi:hypothetical protein